MPLLTSRRLLIGRGVQLPQRVDDGQHCRGAQGRRHLLPRPRARPRRLTGLAGSSAQPLARLIAYLASGYRRLLVQQPPPVWHTTAVAKHPYAFASKKKSIRKTRSVCVMVGRRGRQRENKTIERKRNVANERKRGEERGAAQHGALTPSLVHASACVQAEMQHYLPLTMGENPKAGTPYGLGLLELGSYGIRQVQCSARTAPRRTAPFMYVRSWCLFVAGYSPAAAAACYLVRRIMFPIRAARGTLCVPVWAACATPCVPVWAARASVSARCGLRPSIQAQSGPVGTTLSTDAGDCACLCVLRQARVRGGVHQVAAVQDDILPGAAHNQPNPLPTWIASTLNASRARFEGRVPTAHGGYGCGFWSRKPTELQEKTGRARG